MYTDSKIVNVDDLKKKKKKATTKQQQRKRKKKKKKRGGGGGAFSNGNSVSTISSSVKELRRVQELHNDLVWELQTRRK